MLYSSDNRVLTETVAPGSIRSDGSVLTDDGIASLARLQGGAISEGPVELVELVFMVASDADAHLPACKRFGVQCRAIVDGNQQTLFEGTRVVRRDETEEQAGTFIPVLREASWPHLDTTVHRRLLTGPVEDGPWVTYGWDQPETLTRFAPKHLAGRTVEEVEAEALASLASRGFAPSKIGPGAVGVMGEYASEAILLPDVMKACATAVGASLLAVSVPKESRLVAIRADDFELLKTILASTRSMFDEAKGRRISPIPFLVQDGKIIGFATADDARRAPNKPWYKFW